MSNGSSEILAGLSAYDIRPNERLGQHVLVDCGWLDFIANQTYPDTHVIEIGAGPGNLTERIARLAATVTAVEIDRRYEPLLEDIQKRHPNISVVFGDALKLNYWQLRRQSDRKFQVIANIPFHISEPLMKLFTELPLEEAVITVGDNLSTTLRETNPSRDTFTKLSLMALGFFHVDFLGQIPKTAFYPPPRTESHVLRITPKTKGETVAQGIRIIQQLFANSDSGSVEKIIRTTVQSGASDRRIRDKDERHRHDRRETRRDLEIMRNEYNASGGLTQDERQRTLKNPLSRMQIPQRILQNRFSTLGNEELKTLTRAILDIYPIS